MLFFLVSFTLGYGFFSSPKLKFSKILSLVYFGFVNPEEVFTVAFGDLDELIILLEGLLLML